MKILKTDAVSLKKAVSLLRNGGVVVYPTDTAYGLGCDALNKKAVKKIYKIKNRPAGKPLPAIIGSLALAKKFFKFTPQELSLAKKYWPGALSLVLQIRNWRHPPPHPSPFPPEAERGRVREGVGVVRVPNSKTAKFLSSKLGRPIISTSANLSGMGECYGVKDVIKQFQNQKYQPDLVLDEGRLNKRKPSTIAQVTDGKVIILRRGPVKLKIKNKI